MDDNAITAFLNQRPYTTATRKHYRYILNRLARDHPDPALLTVETLHTWLYSHGWGDQMIWQTFSAVRSYLRWLCGDDHPALALRVAHREAGPQRCIDQDTANRLLASFDVSTNFGIRDRAIASLLLDTGLRESEMCRLEIKRMDLTKRLLSVLCKGEQWGWASYSRQTAENVIDWLAVRRVLARQNVGSVFIALGGVRPGAALTVHGLAIIVRRWGERIGVKMSPHDFRRGFAVMSTQAGAPSRLVQIAGRWSSIEMVERYTRSLRLADFERYFPVDHLEE